MLGSTFTAYKTPALVDLDFHPTFTAKLLRKDMELGLAAARELEVPMPVSALVGQIIATTCRRRLRGSRISQRSSRMQAGAAGVDLRERLGTYAATTPPGASGGQEY